MIFANEKKINSNQAANTIFVQKIFTKFIIKMGKKKTASVSQQPQKSRTQAGQSLTKQKSENKKKFAKIYLEYSRRKYQKYRLQFPKMRESDIIDKIIKEWQALSEQDKLTLQKQFIQIGGSDFLNDSKSKSKSKSKSGSDSVVKNVDAKNEEVKPQAGQGSEIPKKKKKPSPKVRVFVQKATDRNRNYMQDSDFNRENKEKPELSDNQSIEIVVKGEKKVIRKTKMISKSTKQTKSTQVSEVGKKKPKESQYHAFFKYYYSRLTSEHPRWSPSQITTIIKLLWKKRSMTPGRKSRKLQSGGESSKPISGRVMYRRQKEAGGLNYEQIKILWKLLPFESKKYWEKKGRGSSRKSTTSPTQSLGQLKKVMKSGSQGNNPQRSHLRWMNNLIKP